ncbi:MAG TPA: SDR family oxidoreductase [Luteimonas sp.]
MKHKPIDQQVIVVTGASSGIGLCTALLAAERGATVVMLARSKATLDAVVDVVTADGGKAEAWTCDVSDRDDVERAVTGVLAAHGRIDTWVNNAGVSIYGRLDEVVEADSRRLFDVNFWGMVNGSLAALPALKSAGGVLVNIGSEVSDAVIGLQGMYAASKHAVKGFTDALRVEQVHVDGGPLSIVLVQPGAVNTPYPQHARNYLEHEPKLPGPLIDPYRVAEAILQAAQSGGRDVKVGAMAHVDTAMSKWLPKFADRMAAMQAGRQEHPMPPRDPRGTLYAPGETGRIHGLGKDGEVLTGRGDQA